MFPRALPSPTAVKTMEPRRDHRTADLREVPRQTRETSNRLADDDLRLENQKLRELLAQLSHEFRTALQAVLGYTELLDAQIHGGLNESQRLYVQRIKQSHLHMLGLINAILDDAGASY